MTRRPHRKEPQVLELIAVGLSNAAIGRQLHMERQTVGLIRHAHNLPQAPRQPLTLEEKWKSFTRPVDGGHLAWTGETGGPSNTPVLRYCGQTHTAAQVAYRIKHGHDPQGYARAECGMQHCVALDHVDDTAARVSDRRALRIVLGMGERPQQCRRGHDQQVHGRLLPTGVAYCRECQREVRAKTPDCPADRRTAATRTDGDQR